MERGKAGDTTPMRDLLPGDPKIVKRRKKLTDRDESEAIVRQPGDVSETVVVDSRFLTDVGKKFFENNRREIAEKIEVLNPFINLTASHVREKTINVHLFNYAIAVKILMEDKGIDTRDPIDPEDELERVENFVQMLGIRIEEASDVDREKDRDFDRRELPKLILDVARYLQLIYRAERRFFETQLFSKMRDLLEGDRASRRP